MRDERDDFSGESMSTEAYINETRSVNDRATGAW